MLMVLAVAQFVALIVLVRRLLPGRTRKPPVATQTSVQDTTVTIIVTSLNEAHRIGPCLAGLALQQQPVDEILVVDSRSTDGTRELVEDACRSDPRMRLLTDDPLPEGWVGKVWALQHGLNAANGEWILGIDADTSPAPGMVAGAITAARASGYDVVSFSPRFGGQGALEQLIQPALLRSLLYRTGAAGANAPPSRILANGQCFLARREVLLRHGGYSAARASFADDVTLARHLASNGVRVGFLDGSEMYTVRSYRSAGEMWREWGRSIDLKDATDSGQQWKDILFLLAVQGLPLPTILLLMLNARAITESDFGHIALLWVNVTLLAIPILLLIPLRHSYAKRHFTYWLSWLAEPAAVLRIALSTFTRKRAWRGRRYHSA